ncbi:hypothetical protein [Christiangramia sp. SM2212]|uniref:Uncharacterized protein n=1 Tax=Christiangramia sediminicola TaxID=3073267 RepID=A0ABU1ESS7_9FLAO|nr:hypothetical protein [Christiangramia sp. SM2212]MDR5591464.1 hypothetical protein [Christiangramia sp. SM2212]
MKITLILIALFHSVFTLNQDPEPPEYNFHDQLLCQGDSMSLGEKQIKFKKIVSDSRCPKGNGITCVWAGEVSVLVEFYEDGIFVGEKIIVGTNLSKGQNEIISNAAISLAEFFGTDDLKINGIMVSPYPEGRRKITPEEYSVNLHIAEKLKSD